MMPRNLAFTLFAATCLGLATTTQARQYQSEVRVIPDSQANAKVESDPEKILDDLDGNDYGQALLLRQLAGQALKDKDNKQAADYLKRAMQLGALSEYAEEEMQGVLIELYIANGQHQELIDALGSSLDQQSDPNPDMVMALANANVQLGQYRDATPRIKRAIELKSAEGKDSVPIDWMRLLLAVQVENKDYKAARKTLQDLIRKVPNERELWLQLANLHLQLKDTRLAVATLELAHRQGMLTGTEERMLFIRLMYKTGAPYEAGTLLQYWMEQGGLPDNANNRRLLASAWSTAREQQLAAGALETLARQTGDKTVWLQLAQVQMDLGNWPAASKALRQALSKGGLGKHTGTTWMTLGIAEYQQGDNDAALGAFGKAAEINSSASLANQWIEYLQSNAARTAAIRNQSQQRETVEVAAGSRFGDESIVLNSRAQQSAIGAAATDRNPLAYTAIGARANANADGSIPEWSGGLSPNAAPKGYNQHGRLADPFPDDEPLFSITAANLEEHAEFLSQGHQQLLRKYPDYRMDVYPTRRSAWYPPAITEATAANKENAELLGPDSLSNAKLGFPFPEPKNGVEIMWNHRLRYRGDDVEWVTGQAVVNPDGKRSYNRSRVQVLYRYANVSNPADISKENAIAYLLFFLSESATPGTGLTVLVRETANSLDKRRSIWALPPGFRKMLRIPPVDYDRPLLGTEDMLLVDQLDMYNGAFDRYDWKLQGKREMYIPYNSYRWNDGSEKYDDMLTGEHPPPELSRYEKHRVWVIEATERLGKRHKFGKRFFYIDEDTWTVVLVENFTRSNEHLWRFQEGHLFQHYNHGFSNFAPMITYDLRDGRYFINRLGNEEKEWIAINTGEIQEKMFVPNFVVQRYAGRR